MYEDTEKPDYRRLIILGVSALVIVVVLWLLVWLIFFRSTGKVVTPHKPATTQSQSAKSGKSSQKPAKSSGSTASGSQQGQVNAPGQSATTTPATTGATPQRLANTGPGDVFLPVAAVAVAGTALSYVRLRKKLAA